MDRAADVLAMSYSYELQAKVFDHMEALERELAKAQRQLGRTPLKKSWAVRA